MEMPIQHINDRILKRMHRKTGRAHIEATIQKLRREIPDIVIRTSLIVGFPGETEDEFEELLSFVKEIQVDRLGVFKYSREEGTPAFKMREQIPDGVKGTRLRKIMKAQAKIATEKNRLFLGSTIKVLVEGESEESEFLLSGRSMQQAPDNIDGV